MKVIGGGFGAESNVSTYLVDTVQYCYLYTIYML